jgi:hypothetical protein
MSPPKWNSFVAASPYGDILQCLEQGVVKRDWQPLPMVVEKNSALARYSLTLQLCFLRRDPRR